MAESKTVEQLEAEIREELVWIHSSLAVIHSGLYNITNEVRHPIVWASPCGRAVIREAAKIPRKFIVLGSVCASLPVDGVRLANSVSSSGVGSGCPYESLPAAIIAAESRIRQMDEARKAPDAGQPKPISLIDEGGF